MWDKANPRIHFVLPARAGVILGMGIFAPMLYCPSRASGGDPVEMCINSDGN